MTHIFETWGKRQKSSNISPKEDLKAVGSSRLLNFDYAHLCYKGKTAKKLVILVPKSICKL